MPAHGNPRPIVEMAVALRDAVKHFESFGISLMRGRISTYADALDAAGSGEQVDRALLWSAACEVSDLVAATTLDSVALQPVHFRLTTICGGDPVFTSESGHDPGRNSCFELITAAMLQTNGGRRKLQSPSDVSATFGGMHLLVECKRPTTMPALGRRLKEGYRQLSEIRRKGYGGFGAIALDVSAIVNPDFGVLVAEDAATAANMVYGQIQRVFRDSNEYLARAARNLRQDAGVHLLLFRVKCMTGDGKEPPNVTQVWHLEPMVQLNSPEFQALYTMMSKLPAFTPGVVAIDRTDWRLPHR